MDQLKLRMAKKAKETTDIDAGIENPKTPWNGYSCTKCDLEFTNENHKPYHGRYCRGCYNERQKQTRITRDGNVCEDCNAEFTDTNHKSYHTKKCRSCFDKSKSVRIEQRHNQQCEECKANLCPDNNRNHYGLKCQDCFYRAEKERETKRRNGENKCRDCDKPLTVENHKDYCETRCLSCHNKVKRVEHKKRYATDLNYRLKECLRSRILQALTTNSKADKTLKLVGASIKHTRNWLEFQFTPEMNWENHGDYWEIDHVKPCSSFDFTDEKQQYECFSWKNIRPLKASINLHKSNRIDHQLIAQHAQLVAMYIQRNFHS